MTILQNNLSPRRLLAAPLVVAAVLLSAGCADDETSPDSEAGEPEGDTATQNETDDSQADDDEADGDENEQSSADGEYSLSEVEENDTPESCWAVIEQSVYDLTDWIDEHPGGADRIEQLCGTDATEQFTSQHSGQESPEQQLSEFEIGTLAD